ncbi:MULTISPECIES: hypothetical protein [unclassified Rathayibacter]|uniref:hypothetical protein n=1 Tax=unclassified Rathayibacter TaxID=2609250 RepID=UPI000CE7F6D6|nr:MULTISPECIES: hypothetical protein [unclassified Rathayibacter]PPF23279.1 hypothetical protein C5C54_17440 [Rathayibacter sp. AY1F2]
MNHFTTVELDSTNPYPSLPPQWGEEAVKIMLDAEPTRAVRRRRRLWTASALAGLVLTGGAGVAVAAPLLNRPVLMGEVMPYVVTVDGESCSATIQVQPEDPANRALNTPEGMAAAEQALRGLDLANLDIGSAPEFMFPPNTPKLAVQQRWSGISSVALQLVIQQLKDQGFTEEVSMASSIDCGSE